MSNQYDGLASYYDRLSRILGRAYRKSKFTFLDELQTGDRLLYLGGGTGENLPYILQKISDKGKVVYFEASNQMIEKAKHRLSPELSSRIEFLHQTDFNGIPQGKYDWVITQFFLDILDDENIHALFHAINNRTDENTKWIFVDFFPVKGKSFLLGLMILFFRIFTKNPRKDLPDYGKFFILYGWQIKKVISFEKGFIQAWLLRRRKMGT